MQICKTRTELDKTVKQFCADKESIAVVPTMGNLHKGHLALLPIARANADRVVVTIYVNPTQFVHGEDFEQYPRSLERDCQLLKKNQVDVVFAPSTKELYPHGTEQPSKIILPKLENILCGAFRPGHFSGVATVVCKLLLLTKADVAVFGEKDYQQLQVIRHMVSSLELPVEIVSVPVVREASGLAISSRNQYLQPEDNKIAASFYQILVNMRGKIISGEKRFSLLEKETMMQLQRSGFVPEYVKICHPITLEEPHGTDTVAILAAVWLKETRLIDFLSAKIPTNKASIK